MSKVTAQEVRSMLGDAAEKFSDKGVNFFRFRLNGAQSAIADKLVKGLASNSLHVPKNMQDEVTEAFGVKTLTPPMMAIVILGRHPVTARTGGFQESSKVLTEAQRNVAEKLANHVNVDLYKNRIRKPATVEETTPDVKEEAPKMAPPKTSTRRTTSKKTS